MSISPATGSIPSDAWDRSPGRNKNNGHGRKPESYSPALSSMNTGRLRVILKETTVVLDDAPDRTVDTNVVELIKPLSKHQNKNKNFVIVDCYLILVGVDRAKALKNLEEFKKLLEEYPLPSSLAAGPTYLDFSFHSGLRSTSDTLRTFALGAAVNLWKIRTPLDLGYTHESAASIVKSGGILITGFTPQKGKT
jgi:hypothetical protein